MDKPENPPAFPMIGTNAHSDQYIEHPGMSLRDWFAGQALAGMLAYHGSYGCGNGPGNNVARAYEHADAMLVERLKKEHG